MNTALRLREIEPATCTAADHAEMSRDRHGCLIRVTAADEDGYSTWRCPDCAATWELPPVCSACRDTGRAEWLHGPETRTAICGCLEGMEFAEREAECADERRANWGRY